mmetsp:Transcript_26528/g.64654  ORF Transcript_26528/g.64654 Transcript_26528/m.64654 type:complete len:607 (+) Transcript_26528:103-1923(+)
MAARKRTNARTAAASTSTTQNKRRKPNRQPLGLKLLGSNKHADDTIVRLYVGNILGRRPSKPPPANIVTPVRHVDIGIVDCHIPRKLLQVSRVTADSLELEVFFDQTERHEEKAAKAHRKCAKLAADICKITRLGETIQVARNATIVLQQHDIFVVAKKLKECDFSYQFQVLPVAQETASISPNQSVEEEEEEEEDMVDEIEKKAASAAALQAELDKMEKKLGFRPYRPTRPMGSTVPNASTPAKSLAPKNFAAGTKSQEEERDKANNHQDSDDDDDSEDEEEERDPQKEATMHATLANTYYKALNTSTPHFGSSLLEMIGRKNEFPTPQLLEDLVKLLTFGPTYHEDYAFFEGNRLQLALEYVQDLLQTYPQEMGPRFLQAASKVAGDGDYWRLLLDQLSILPYEQSIMMTTPTNTNTKNETLEMANQKRTLQSMELQAVSLQFLLILLQQSEDMMHQVQRDTKEVTRHVAQTMAQVWVSRGHYLLITNKDKDNKNGKNDQQLLLVNNAMEQVTRQLTKVLGSVTNFDTLKEQDLVDMLWSAMDDGFRQTNNSKQNRRQILLTWIFQLQADLTTIQNNEKWATVTDGLVKRARLRKEYNAISKVE